MTTGTDAQFKCMKCGHTWVLTYLALDESGRPYDFGPCEGTDRGGLCSGCEQAIRHKRTEDEARRLAQPIPPAFQGLDGLNPSNGPGDEIAPF